MSNATSGIGSCPFCGSTLESDAILVEYEVDGETRVFAECLQCDEPVKPE